MMTLRNLLSLALRLMYRDLSSGHLRLLFITLLVATTTHNTIGFVAERLYLAMTVQTAQFLGGDLVIRSPNQDQDLELKANTLTLARVAEFPSVVMAGEAMQLSAVKAVSDNYPLKAPLRISDQPFAPDRPIDHGPPMGSAWVDAQLLSRLQIKLGDSVEVGDIRLQVTQIITREPDHGDGFYNLVPRLMMHWRDLPAANLIQPGSRVNFFYQYTGPADSVAYHQQLLDSQLKPGQSILSVQNRSRSISSALERSSDYLELARLTAILLASVALAMGARFFSEMRYDSAALMRCFGLTSIEILLIFTCQLIILALFSGLLGGALGWLLHLLGAELLGQLLPDDVPLPSLWPLVSGCGLALLIILGFGMPALIALQRTPPLRVLRKTLTPQPLANTLVTALVAFLVVLLLWWYIRDWQLALSLLIGMALAGMVTYLVTVFFMALIRLVGNHSPLPLRAGLRNLSRRQNTVHIQLLGFGLTTMAMLVVFLVRTELMTTWQNQLPERAPNHFVMNILPSVKTDVETFLQQRGIASQPLYPMLPGRLTHINGLPARQASLQKEVPEALNRDLNLSWTTELPSDNQLVAGRWWPATSTTDKKVSIEQQLADKLGVGLGDTLSFFVNNTQFDATITSIRAVTWESFQPNFYMLFAPEDMEDLPHTYLTSFYLEDHQQPILPELVKQFPALSLLEVDAILAQVRLILSQVSAGVEFMLLFVLSAGFCITYATLTTTMPERYREGTIMRVLGAHRSQLLLQQWSEFFCIGLFSGLVACAGTELVRWFIFMKFFNSGYTPQPWIWIIVPPLLGLLIGLAGQFSSNKILRQPPTQALRE